MDWPILLLLILGGVLFIMLTGLPVAFCFIIVTAIGAFILWGGEAGLLQLTLSMYGSITRFSLVPIPLFILMGSVMFYSGIAPNMIDAVDKWLGRLPGRLGLVAVGCGTIMAAVSGSSMASTALLGSVLTPEMEKRGYKKSLSLGTIVGSGCLAPMIPPSSLAVMLGSLADIDIGQLLIGIIIPGLIMAAVYATYIIVRCILQPSIAPAYDVPYTPFSEKLRLTAKHILPLSFIIFLVTGLIFFGITTPTEAAAAGTLGSFILAAFYRNLNWKMIKLTFESTLKATVMIFLILVAAQAFSQVLAFSGASRGLTKFAVSLPVAPILIVLVMQVVLLFLGMFINIAPIMLITIPVFMPIIHALGFSPVWFGVMFLLNMEIGTITPPFGTGLFVMKGAAPSGTTLEDVYRAALPFVALDLLVLMLLLFFPQLVLWLPGLM